MTEHPTLDETEGLIALAEIPAVLGNSYASAWALSKSGDLGHSVKLGGRYFHRRADVERYAAGGRKTSLDDRTLENIGRAHLCAVQVHQVREVMADRQAAGEDVAALEGQVAFLRTIQGGLLRQIEGDRREAEAAGNAEAAAALALFLAVFPAATYERDAEGRWRVIIPGIGTSAPALAPRGEAV